MPPVIRQGEVEPWLKGTSCGEEFFTLNSASLGERYYSVQNKEVHPHLMQMVLTIPISLQSAGHITLQEEVLFTLTFLKEKVELSVTLGSEKGRKLKLDAEACSKLETSPM
jgi:hypothetical protein